MEEERLRYISEQTTRAEAQVAQGQLAFLVEASRRLSSSLDLATTFQTIARLLVPEFADWGVIDIVEEDGSIRQVAVAHVDTAKEALVFELRRRYPPDLNRPYGLPRVLMSGEPELYPEIHDEWRVAAASDADHLRLMRQLGAASSITVPLLARGRTLGALTLVAAESGRRFTATDLELAVEIASRCAFAVDNARLFTAEHRARADAEEARAHLQRFVGMAAHEIGNPLAIVLGYAQMLRNRAESADLTSDQKALHSIIEAARKMWRLTDDLRDAARIGAGRFEVNPMPTDLAEIARGVVEEARLLTTKHDLLVDAPEHLEGIWDAVRLNQLLTNLVSNAIKYSPGGGAVRLVMRQMDGEARVSVSDQGDGMTSEQIHQLFQPFGRLEQESERGIAGAGLGLYICKAIAEAHGGRIRAESEPGTGSTFHVALPLSSPPP